MEGSINSFLEDVLKNDGVTGCLLSDKHGLCLSSAGCVDPKSSGIISAIAQHISELEPASNAPVISISGDQGKIFIKQGTNVTTAIFKAPSLSGA